MSEKNKGVFYALHDELIFQVRELLQLALLTDTNLVDHLRQLRVCPSEEKPDYLVLTKEYKQYHLDIVKNMVEKVEELQKELGKEVANSSQ